MNNSNSYPVNLVIIADPDTIVGFKIAGLIPEINAHFFPVDATTEKEEIEKYYREKSRDPNVGIIFITEEIEIDEGETGKTVMRIPAVYNKIH